MTLARLQTRLVKMEAQWRPAVVAAVLGRVRQCAPADLRTCLLDALTTVERTTALAIMAQLTDTALKALAGPDAVRLMEMLSIAELAALARGDPVAARQFQCALRALQHKEHV